MRQNPVLADPSQKAHTWPCKPWHLHFPPPSPWWHSWGLFPCYITAALSISGGSSSSRKREEPGPSLGFVGTGPGLAAWRVCSSSESLAALGQLMAVDRPPCWLAPCCEQGAHSEVGGEEQLCERVSLSPLPSAYPRAPWCPFFSACPVVCPLHAALGQEGCPLCKS